MDKTILIERDLESNKLTNFDKGSFNEFKNKNVNKNLYNISFNPFISVATPLFRELLEIQNSDKSALNMDQIRSDFISKINIYNDLALEYKIDNMEILVSRYILCTFIDEILSVIFSDDDSWFNKSLLSVFHNEAYGGENFFHLMDKFLKTPANYINILELMYVCLSLGFLGKYRIINRGEMEVSNIKENLYKQIKITQGREPIDFYVKVEPIKQKHKLFNKISYPLLVSLVLISLISLYLLLSYTLYQKDSSFNTLIDEISQKEFKIKIIKNKE